MKSKKNHFFYWQGLNSQGEHLEGYSYALSSFDLKKTLNKRGILCRKSHKKIFCFKLKINHHLNFFLRQLALMIKANIPLFQSFEIILQSPYPPYVIKIIHLIREQIIEGFSLAEAFNQYPNFFNSFIIGLIEAGEKSGNLELMLIEVVSYKEKIEKFKKNLRQIMIYPSLILTVAFVLSLALLLFIVPQFQEIFNSLNADLPFFTQSIINFSLFIKEFGIFILISTLIASYSLILSLKNLPQIQYFKDKFLLKLPMLGSILVKIILSRFSYTLAMTLQSGLTLVEALAASEHSLGNSWYTKAVCRIKEDICLGIPFYLALQTRNMFPTMMIEMVRVGEETGSLELMLNKIHDFYEEDINHAIITFNKLIEPLIISLVGILVGSLVIALYLPIFKLGKIV